MTLLARERILVTSTLLLLSEQPLQDYDPGSAEARVTEKGSMGSCRFGASPLLRSTLPTPTQAHNWRSRERYWMASEMCSEVRFSEPARSAIVRATFKIRS